MIKWFLIKWLRWRVAWSNWYNYHRDLDVVDYELLPEDQGGQSLVDFLWVARRIFASFKYQFDPADQLFDIMLSPAVCYERYALGELIDDCDGFHAALLHVLKKNGTQGRLITYVAEDIKKSHTVLAFRGANRWSIIDYDRATGFKEDLEEAVQQVAGWHGTKALAWNAVDYNYETQRYEVKEKSCK